MKPSAARWFAPFLLLAATASVSGQTQAAQIESLLREQQYTQAVDEARAALRQSPDDHRLWTLEGMALSMSGNTAAASHAFEQALKLSPDDPAALRAEAQILFTAGETRAVPLLERILKQDPDDATAHEMLAGLEAKQGDCAAAIQHFESSGQAMQRHLDSVASYGGCLLRMHQPERAVPVFGELAAGHPERTWAQYDLAVALIESKQNAEALKVLDPLLSSTQNDPDLLSLASEAYEATGDTPRAVALLRQALVLNPDNAAYYVAFTALCLSHDAFQVGIDMDDIGIRRLPADPSLFIARGLLHAQLAQYDKAEADFAAAERLDSRQSLSDFALDLTDLQQNHSEAAVAKIRAQLRAHPDSALLHYLLARLLWNQGNQTNSPAAEEARRYAEAAVRLKPDMVEARNLLADLDIAAEQYQAAVQESRLALQQAPDDQTAVYHLIVGLRHEPPGAERDEIPSLVKTLSALQQKSLEQETERKRFSLVETGPGKPPSDH